MYSHSTNDVYEVGYSSAGDFMTSPVREVFPNRRYARIPIETMLWWSSVRRAYIDMIHEQRKIYESAHVGRLPDDMPNVTLGEN